jgi:hypothetical protein
MQATWVIALALFIHEGHSHDTPLSARQYKVGKNGEINVSENTSIGNSILMKGRYKVVHDPNGDEHWVMFSPVAKNGSSDTARQAVQVKTRQLLPTSEKLSGFVIHAMPDVRAGSSDKNRPRYRIMKVTVGGERFEHLF